MTLGKSKKLPELHCLECSNLIDRTTCVEGDHYPDTGDVTVCLFCGHLMIYDHNPGLILRNPTNAKLYHLAVDKRILAIQKARGLLKVKK